MLAVAQLVRDLGGQFLLLLQFAEPVEAGLGGPPPQLPHGLLVGVVVGVQVQEPHQQGQREALHQEGEEHHAERDEDQPPALGERLAGVQGERDGQGQRDRRHPAHPGPPEDDALLPADRGVLVVPGAQLLGEPAGRQQPQQPDQYDDRDHHGGVAEHARPAGAGLLQDGGQLQPDQSEGDAGDEDLDDLPEGVADQPVSDLVGVGRPLGQVERADHDGEHAGAVDLLREGVRGERHQQVERDLLGGVLQHPGELAVEPAEADADDHREHGGEDEAQHRVLGREVAADDGVDGQRVDHDRRDVVEQALALQYRDQPARQSDGPGDGDGGHRVGRRDEGADRDGGGQRQSGQQPVDGARDRDRGDHHQGDGEQQDRADVGPEVADGGAPGDREDQRRQHQRQDQVGVELDVGDLRHDRHHEPERGHQHGLRHAGPAGQRDGDHRGEQHQEEQRQLAHGEVPLGGRSRRVRRPGVGDPRPRERISRTMGSSRRDTPDGP